MSCKQEFGTRNVNKSCEQKLWVKLWTKVWIKQNKQRLWTRVVNKSCEQELLTYVEEEAVNKFETIVVNKSYTQKFWAKAVIKSSE